MQSNIYDKKQSRSITVSQLREPLTNIVAPFLETKELGLISRVSKLFKGVSDTALPKRMMSTVVQGNEDLAEQNLNKTSELLLKKGTATDYSGRTIKNRTPFQAALCAGDVEMCEMMKPFFDDLTDEKQDGRALMQEQFNAIFPDGVKDHIQKQKEDTFDFVPIIRAINHARECDLRAALENQDNDSDLCTALKQFRGDFTEKSLNESVFNPHHLLCVFKIFNEHFSHPRVKSRDLLWAQDLVWVQVIGFCQRFVPACYAQAFAQGIYFSIQERKPPRRSFNFEYSDGSFYPLNNNSSGLGYSFAAGVAAAAGPGWKQIHLHGMHRDDVLKFFKEYVDKKTRGLENLLATQPGIACQSLRVSNFLK